MSAVSGLGYIGCAVKDADAWARMAAEVFGLEQRKEDGAAHYYRMDEHHHRLALYPSDRDALEYIGWEVATEEDLRSLERSLATAGVKITRGDAALRKERAVFDLVHFQGPDGVRTELFFGRVLDKHPLVSPTGAAGFNTGRLGMGHVVLAAADRERTTRWYCEHLGFRLTDYIFWDELQATFLHCNPRHHSLAITNQVMGMQPGEMSHFMLEARSLDDVGRAYDTIREKGYSLGLTLGRHTNDQTISFYVYTPSGWLVEYGCGGLVIEDEAAWTPKYYDATKIWGHDFLPPPAGSAQRL